MGKQQNPPGRTPQQSEQGSTRQHGERDLQGQAGMLQGEAGLTGQASQAGQQDQNSRQSAGNPKRGRQEGGSKDQQNQAGIGSSQGQDKEKARGWDTPDQP